MRRLAILALAALVISVLSTERGSSAVPESREWSRQSPGDGRPAQKQLRSETPPITWIRVHPSGTSPCSPDDTTGSPDGQTIEHVWCFEGAGGDSTWPAVPQGLEGRHAAFDHWSRFAPPEPSSMWHATSVRANPFDPSNDYNAWCGCALSEGCVEATFWGSSSGYGDDWSEALVLDCSGHDASGGGTIRFDLRYDTECEYDYVTLEYEASPGVWDVVRDMQSEPAWFTGVSGRFINPCAADYFGHSGGAHGTSLWLDDVAFPIPSGIDALKLRWRAWSDFRVSDADSSIDTEGIAAIDDVLISFADGSSASDDFATGDFGGIQDAGPHSLASTWSAVTVGNPYDGWHLGFNPTYVNQGNSCQFSDDWMWAAKPAVGPIPPSASGFDFYLVTPAIDVASWTGGVIEYSEYLCAPHAREDFLDRVVRYHQSGGGWSSWRGLDGWIYFGGCQEWEFNRSEDLSRFLSSGVDSLQVGWRLLDLNVPGDFAWGFHAQVNCLIDNVSIGSYDVAGTYFSADESQLFQDTFSLGDPAHAAALRNDEQGDWIGSGGLRDFNSAESLSVDVRDRNGVTEGNVELWWRHDGGGAGFGAWDDVTMDLALRAFGSTSDEGLYRAIIGVDDGGNEDLTAAGDGRIWLAGTTVQYYVRVTDDLSGVATYPAGAGGPDPTYFDFSVLPMYRTGAGQEGETYLIVNDTGGDLLDFENSDLGGPTWTAVYRSAIELTECGLQGLGIQYDRYDVKDNLEPPGRARPAAGIGGFLDELGVPLYDCLIWIHGDLGDSTFSAPSRSALRDFLDNGGVLFAAGDGIVTDLAVQDPTFLSRYFGAASAGSQTEEYVLNARGETGTSLEGIQCGLFGNCPTHRFFDRLSLAAPVPGQSNQLLMTYRDGGPSDEGKVCLVKNVPGPGAGTAVLAGFDLSALLSCDSRTCVLSVVLASDLGRTIPVDWPCVNSGVGVPDASPAVSFSLGGAAPNPFSKTTAISFSVPRAGAVSLDLYDLRGRKVRTLVDEVLDPGGHTRIWDGRTSSEESAAAGIYFYRLKAAGKVATGRVVLLR